MQVEKIPLDPESVRLGRQITKPLVRANPNLNCGLPGCNCSPGYWLTVSSGNDFLRVIFKDEAEYRTALGIPEGTFLAYGEVID